MARGGGFPVTQAERLEGRLRARRAVVGETKGSQGFRPPCAWCTGVPSGRVGSGIGSLLRWGRATLPQAAPHPSPEGKGALAIVRPRPGVVVAR
eukprot:7134468-Alexandrium_andersonii.AAC.1